MKSVDRFKLATEVGKVKDLLNKGYGITAIAVKLGKPESTVRALAKIVEDAEKAKTESK